MNWNEQYPEVEQPSYKDIANFVASPLWEDINAFLQENYDVKPELSYSNCGSQPGWNLKYKKAGRALCVLYPMDGFFITLVVIGNKEYDEALEVIAGCTDYVRELFEKTDHSSMGRWLMINTTSEAILEDAKRLIQVRRKIKR